jgi:tRNA A-37 threonylcarbamoyl transferase component Bud32
MIGQLLDHYRVISKVGEGGMGVVYRAHDEILHRDVAIKVVADSRVMDRAGKDQLLHEARAGSALNHPNICTIYEVIEVDGRLYIAMELVDGKSLSDLIGAAGLPVESVLRYGGQLAAALSHAHGRNIVHHDLKSSNVVVTPEGLIKVLDFGLARRMPAAASVDETVTFAARERSGEVSGTLSYMAPEVLRGEPGDSKSDLWALGIVLYEAVAGQPPFRGKTPFETSAAIIQETLPPLPSRIPPGLWGVIQRCLAKRPAERYQQASEVKAALEAVESASMTGAQPSTQPAGFQTTVMRGTRHLRPANGDVMLLVGTTKGAFFLRSAKQRSRWDVAGPYFHGHAVYSLAFDQRNGRRRLWASTQNFWGTFLRSSDDLGRTWTNPLEANVKFPADCGTSLINIWQIVLGRHDNESMYCGVEPAALFESRNSGETWSLVRGLFDHPHRPRWMPGNGGLALHTIVEDPLNPQRMYVAISAGGVYRTEDGGLNWRACNRGIRVMFQPDKFPEFGQCVHKIALHPARPERMFLQNHWGLYRSDDGAESWQDIAGGVPSDFGFAMVMHPHDPDCVYIVPVESDEFRCTPDGRLRIYRTRNAGRSWEPLARGLPQNGAYETVLRDAMATDTLEQAGIYFGTRSGQLFASTDEGRTWNRILGGLPPVVCVRAVSVGEPRLSGAKARKPRMAGRTGKAPKRAVRAASGSLRSKRPARKQTRRGRVR